MYDTSQAVACLTSVFLEVLQSGEPDLESFENGAIRIGNDCIARAYGAALELYDAQLASNLPAGARVRERRGRLLSTLCGDVSFTRHVCIDGHGNPLVPLDEAIGLPHGARVSPAAASFLVMAGAEVSYAKAAGLLELSGGSRVSPRTVMRSVRRAGDACEEEDAALASELYEHGSLPRAESAAEGVCIESDGTYVALQGGGKAEIRALVAYAGKEERGGRSARVDPVRFGCVSSARTFWSQGMAAVATRFDLSRISSCDFGFDGEAAYKAGAAWLPSKAEARGHLDPFHVNRAVAACFDADRAAARYQVMECLWAGCAADAADLLEEYGACSEARPKAAAGVARYLRNNAEFIGVPGPSLGTMESEQEHLYKSRMASVPCAWSTEGASDMARIRSRKYSNRPIPKPTREASLGEGRRRARERRIEKSLSKGPVYRVESVGSGWEYPHCASVADMAAEIRYAAGLDGGMVLGV